MPFITARPLCVAVTRRNFLNRLRVILQPSPFSFAQCKPRARDFTPQVLQKSRQAQAPAPLSGEQATVRSDASARRRRGKSVGGPAASLRYARLARSRRTA